MSRWNCLRFIIYHIKIKKSTFSNAKKRLKFFISWFTIICNGIVVADSRFNIQFYEMELHMPKIFNLWDIYNILIFPWRWFTTDCTDSKIIMIMMNYFAARVTVEQRGILPVEIIVPLLTNRICKTIVADWELIVAQKNGSTQW